MPNIADGEKLLETTGALAEEMTSLTGRMTQVRLELDIAKYSGPDADALLAAMDEVQNKMCHVAYLAGHVVCGAKEHLKKLRQEDAMRRLGGPK